TRAQELLRNAGDLVGAARSWCQIAYCHLLRGDFELARQELEGAVALARLASDPFTEAVASRRLGFFLLEQGEYEPAERAYRRTLELFASVGASWRTMQAKHALAVLCVRKGDLSLAASLLEEVRGTYAASATGHRLSRWRQAFGWLATFQGESGTAVRELGA